MTDTYQETFDFSEGCADCGGDLPGGERSENSLCGDCMDKRRTRLDD